MGAVLLRSAAVGWGEIYLVVTRSWLDEGEREKLVCWGSSAETFLQSKLDILTALSIPKAAINLS